jgi:Nucleoside H+ symporter
LRASAQADGFSDLTQVVLHQRNIRSLGDAVLLRAARCQKDAAFRHAGVVRALLAVCLRNAQGLVFMYYAGILMQGMCFAFFFVTGQVYVNNTAPGTIRASALH